MHHSADVPCTLNATIDHIIRGPLEPGRHDPLLDLMLILAIPVAVPVPEPWDGLQSKGREPSWLITI